MFVIAVTNRDWFDYQCSHDFIDEINFWTPSQNCPRRISPGDYFVFKLAGHGDYIGGYGTFVEYKYQSLDDAWNEFGRKNGADTKDEFVKILTSFDSNDGVHCGSVVLKNVVFFDSFVNRLSAGIFEKPAQLFAYSERLFPFSAPLTTQNAFTLVKSTLTKKKTQSRTIRDGQAAFHTAVSKAYQSKCCVTGEITPELLQAAHIQDYINKDSHHIQNGLLLRVDIHKLFDSGLLYIDQKYQVHISPIVKSTVYKQYEGRTISLPKDKFEWPSLDALLFKEQSFRK